MENKLIELLQDAQTYLSTPHHIQTCLSMSYHIISDFQTITLQTPTALAFVAQQSELNIMHLRNKIAESYLTTKEIPMHSTIQATN